MRLLCKIEKLLLTFGLAFSLCGCSGMGLSGDRKAFPPKHKYKYSSNCKAYPDTSFGYDNTFNNCNNGDR